LFFANLIDAPAGAKAGNNDFSREWTRFSAHIPRV
jgi:hypothetical protein